jgi:heptosyltransferase-1
MRVAIVKLSALGDIVHAMVALQFIKEYARDIRIDWVVEECHAELLRHNPDIDRVLTVNLRALKNDKSAFFQEFGKIRSYAGHRYNLIIDAQGLLKSALVARLISNCPIPCAHTRKASEICQHIAGFDRHSIREKAASWLYDVKIACAYDANTIDRNALILSRPLGLGISREQIVGKKPFLFFRDEDPIIYDYLLKDKPNVVLVIGSTWESRNYPPEKFVTVAEALQENCIAVWGNEQERATAEWMAERSRLIKVIPKKLDLNALKALIAKADLLIGNDTGPTHMAWALNRPSITLFGPTPVSRICQTDINKAVKSHSPVNPYKLNKEDYSIREIDEREIIGPAKSLLSATFKPDQEKLS